MKKVILQIILIITSQEKIVTFHNVIIPIRSVVNKNKNKNYYHIFLEKGSYKEKSNKRYFSLLVFLKQRF